jgi:hypothetical protein
LQQGVRRRPHLRLRRRGPMAEREKTDVFHGGAAQALFGPFLELSALFVVLIDYRIISQSGERFVSSEGGMHG